MAQGSFGKAGIIPPVVLARPSSLIEMSCRFALMCCIALCGTVNFASSCDAAGMQKCNQDYFSAVPQASGNQSCVVMDTFLSCLNTACAGCQSRNCCTSVAKCFLHGWNEYRLPGTI